MAMKLCLSGECLFCALIQNCPHLAGLSRIASIIITEEEAAAFHLAFPEAQCFKTEVE